MARPRLRIAGTVLSTRDAQALAGFYERLLGWPRLADEAGWVVLRPDGHLFCLCAGEVERGVRRRSGAATGVPSP